MGQVSQSPSSKWYLRREGALPMILGSAFSGFLGRHISASPLAAWHLLLILQLHFDCLSHFCAEPQVTEIKKSLSDGQDLTPHCQQLPLRKQCNTFDPVKHGHVWGTGKTKLSKWQTIKMFPYQVLT